MWGCKHYSVNREIVIECPTQHSEYMNIFTVYIWIKIIISRQKKNVKLKIFNDYDLILSLSIVWPGSNCKLSYWPMLRNGNNKVKKSALQKNWIETR